MDNIRKEENITHIIFVVIMLFFGNVEGMSKMKHQDLKN